MKMKPEYHFKLILLCQKSLVGGLHDNILKKFAEDFDIVYLLWATYVIIVLLIYPSDLRMVARHDTHKRSMAMT